MFVQDCSSPQPFRLLPRFIDVVARKAIAVEDCWVVCCGLTKCHELLLGRQPLDISKILRIMSDPGSTCDESGKPCMPFSADKITSVNLEGLRDHC